MLNKLWLVAVLLCVSALFASVESSANTLFLLLFDKRGDDSENPYVQSGFEDYLSKEIAGDAGRVFSFAVDVSAQSASRLSAILADRGDGSLYEKALGNWFRKSTDERLWNWKRSCGNRCSLDDLKNSCPELLPLRWIVVAEGVSGLVAREYLQGADYAGEFSKVLFFDTPHEGTGFADMALFQNSQNPVFKTPDAKALAGLIPLALSAYVLGGSGTLQDAVLSLAKSAILGMAENAGNVSGSFAEADFWGGYAPGSDALWYLAEDAGESDEKYRDLIVASTADVMQNLGGTEWLNSMGMQTDYAAPSYGIVYSYGFPTVGNGRRTLGDFAEQAKNHVSREKLVRVMEDSLKSVFSAAGMEIANASEDISVLAGELLDGKFSVRGGEIVESLVQKYGELENVLGDSKFTSVVRSLSELKSLRFNRDDLPKTALKILRILEKFIPESYKSELYSIFMEAFSPEVANVLGTAARCAVSGGKTRDCVRSGISTYAQGLSNYGWNFFDEGVFDVPVYSAYASRVAAFRGAPRFGYDLAAYAGEDSALNAYGELLSEVGKLETIRKELDAGLRLGCGVLFSPYDKICKAAAFAANVALIADVSGRGAKISSRAKALKGTKNLSFAAALKSRFVGNFNGISGKKSFSHPDLERMLFDSPRIFISSDFKKGDGEKSLDSIVPGVLTKESGVSGEFLYETAFAEKDAVPATFEDGTLFAKDVRYDRESGSPAVLKREKLWRWKAPTVRHFVEEYRFVVEDLEPDSLLQILLDFNAGVRMAYERDGSAWNACLQIGGLEWSCIKGVPAPVGRDGLFAFRPEDFFAWKIDGKEHLLSAIQQEGPNWVGVHVVNKLGMTGSAEFTFLFESTPPLFEAGWPESFATVSKVDFPYIFYNKQDGTPEFIDRKVSIFAFDDGNRLVGSVGAESELFDASRGTYKISADLTSLWESDSLESGHYVLEWEVGILDEQGKRAAGKWRMMVYVDRDAPKLEISLKQSEISGKSAGDWGSIVNKGTVSGKGIRALRILVKGEDGATAVLQKKSQVSEAVLNFGWDGDSPIPEGNAQLVVQAVGYAAPSEEMKKILEGDSLGNLDWDKVVKENGVSFLDGLNGTILETEIFIDATSPSIMENSFSASASRMPSAEDLPLVLKKSEELSLGIRDTLKLRFQMDEPLLGRDSETVSIQIQFDDTLHAIRKVYFRDTAVTKFASEFEFEEPSANRLADGIYDVKITLVDQAGNSSESVVLHRLVVDRTAPRIVELMHGDVAFRNVSELKEGKAYVSQVSDAEWNRSELECFAKASSGGVSTGWFSVGTETESQKGAEHRPFAFSLGEKVLDFPDGLWTIRLGCFDAVGNYGEQVDFFGMGRRYPRITFPEEGLGDYFSGKILIEGTTPNPSLKGEIGNAEFRMEWCTLDFAECRSDGISYLTRSVSEQARPIAVWDAEGLSGDYAIRLTVVNCTNEESCDSATAEKVVSLNDGLGNLTASGDSPKLVLAGFPKEQVPATDGDIQIKLESPDTAAWTLEVQIEVQSPKDSSEFVPAKKVSFESVSASPFDGEPAQKNDGLSVWQSGKIWNVLWKGVANAAQDGMIPRIALKYQKDAVRFVDAGEIFFEEDSSVKMPSIDVGEFAVPAYDVVRNFEIRTDEVHFQFESDSAFTLDISSVEGGSGKIFCGKSSVAASDAIPASAGSPMLFVFPNRYISTVAWNGLTQENLYPGGSEVKLHAFAYKKSDKTQVLFLESSWNQMMEDFRITTGGGAMENFYVGFSDSSESAFAKSDYHFEFGIVGKPAFVTADVLDANGNRVKRLMEKQLLLAGTSKTAYSVSWDGMSETGFASTAEGKYTLKITAERNGEEKTLLQNFNLILANKLIAAPLEKTANGESPSALSIDEAIVDEMGNLRFVGNPDYLLEADVSAVTLPVEQRTVEYNWSVEGSQHPVFFEKNRYSLGIHRHRREFPVMVAVLIAGYGHNLTSAYNWNKRSVNYKIFCQKVTLREGESFDIAKIKLNPWNKIVGFDEDGNTKLEMGISVKIFPATVIDLLSKNNFKKESGGFYSKGHFNHDSYSDPEKKMSDHRYTWNLIWNDALCKNAGKKDCPDKKDLKLWWNNFENNPLYWESGNQIFYYDKGKFKLENSAAKLDCTPSSSTENNSNQKFVCPEDSDYAVHRNMLKIEVSPVEEKYSYGSYNDCWSCSNQGSHTNMAVHLSLQVKDDYWHPPYGYNNLANTFTRLDPENIALFGDDGYCNLKTRPCELFNGENWNPETKNGKLTAFETLELAFQKEKENPLLFADDFLNEDTLFSSSYSLKFYNAKESPTPFRAVVTWEVDGGLSRLDLNSDSRILDSIETPFLSQRVFTRFWVAPMLTEEAAKSDKDIVTAYPVKMDDVKVAEIKSDISRVCSECKFYSGMASGLHFAVGDWKLENWTAEFLSGGFLKNPLTASAWNPKDFSPIASLNSFSPENDDLEMTHAYPVSKNDSASENVWIVPSVEFLKTRPEWDESVLGNGFGPVGEFSPKIQTPGWSLLRGADGWSAENEGEPVKSRASFIWSNQKPWKYNRGDLSHTVSLRDVALQDSADKILGKPWMKNVQIGEPFVYARGTRGETGEESRERHPYFSATYDSASEFFTVMRSRALDYSRRESETATLRGRVPGEHQKWNLFYVQNGMQYALKTGVQEDAPVEEPFPVLDYAEMNRLQGNTSFFLTYGGIHGENYFYQLDLHVGDLLKAGEGGLVSSMYGNVSVDFPPGAWGESDVDVTVRTVPKAGEYNFSAFKNLEVVGPVVEILPSHDFSGLDDALWPLVHVRLPCESLGGVNPVDLKVYKPNFETSELMPLESQSVMAFDKNNQELPMDAPHFNSQCSEIEISAKTKSFSTFVVMTVGMAEKVESADSSSVGHHALVCGELPADTLWMGTANGWLEYPYPCSGKSNYLLQLKSGEFVRAEHMAASGNPIVWEARASEFAKEDSVYSSRIVFYGVDGSSFQLLGPQVRADSVPPVIGDAEVSVVEEGSGRILQIDVSASDSGSGILKSRVDVYFGGSLLESRTFLGTGILAENFVLDRETLYRCLGCRATVRVSVEDKGHNHVEISQRTEALFPYPQSLALWYPLSEGVGKTAFEATGRGPDIDLSHVKFPWQNGKSLRLFAGDSAHGKNSLSAWNLKTPFSVEVEFSAGHAAGSVLGFLGNGAWSLGVDPSRHYYLELPSGRIPFTAVAERNVKNHLVLTVSEDAVVLYKNGSFDESKKFPPGSGIGCGGTLSIGGVGGEMSVSGEISNVRIYRSALTPEQVLALYKDGLDLSSDDMVAARAVELDWTSGLTVEQSCGLPGMAYLRQRTATSTGMMTWTVDLNAARYHLYLLTLDVPGKSSKVEILQDGASLGIYPIESTGLWKKVRVGELSLGISGRSRISIRPVGNLGVAAIALVNSSQNLAADWVNFGEGSWKNPQPRVSVQMKYENSGDVTWASPSFRLQNLTGESFFDARLRYYYAGEGDAVQAVSFYPNAPMSIRPDAGTVFYGELFLDESIPAWGSPYYGNGPQIGLHRTESYFPWVVTDDPSFVTGAEDGFAEATGVALLDAEGFLLNYWACYDADGPAMRRQGSVRVLAKDSKEGSSQSSLISMVVENTGAVPVEDFEVRYYFRDSSGTAEVDFYSHPFSSADKMAAGGNLYYASFDYAGTILNPGEKSDFGNGVNFEIHAPGWSPDFDSSDDPSHSGLGEEFREADSVIVLDKNGNLLWGNVPQPVFDGEYRVKTSPENFFRVEGSTVYVTVSAKGNYTLETVNAAGMPLVSLFRGTWDAGEHSVSLDGHSFDPGCYLVLRRGLEILSWKIFK